MAKAKFRCYRECFAYNKHFKAGDWFPQAWVDAKYAPQPEYFVPEGDYEEKMDEVKKVGRTKYSAADDPRPTADLIADLKKMGLEVPRDWNRQRIWSTLKQREMAEAHTEPTARKQGRPPKE